MYYAGRGPVDRSHRQEGCGDVRGAERAWDTREGGGAHQGQGGAGPRARGLAVHRGSEGHLRLLPRPRPQ